MIQLNYRDPRPIYEQVKDGIRKLAYSGMIGPDEKLPSVRELASKLAINPNTISRAYKELEQEGFLYSMTGKGTFINAGFDLNDRRKEELYQKFDKVVKELLTISIPAEELKNRLDELEEKHGKSSLNMVHADMQLKRYSQTDENCQVKKTTQSKEDMLLNKMKENSRSSQEEACNKNQEGGSIDDTSK